MSRTVFDGLYFVGFCGTTLKSGYGQFAYKISPILVRSGGGKKSLTGSGVVVALLEATV